MLILGRGVESTGGSNPVSGRSKPASGRGQPIETRSKMHSAPVQKRRIRKGQTRSNAPSSDRHRWPGISNSTSFARSVSETCQPPQATTGMAGGDYRISRCVWGSPCLPAFPSALGRFDSGSELPHSIRSAKTADATRRRALADFAKRLECVRLAGAFAGTLAIRRP